MPKRIDWNQFIGQKYGTIEIVRIADKKYHVIGRCDCGDEREYYVYNLTRGMTSTCWKCSNVNYEVLIGTVRGELAIHGVTRNAEGSIRLQCKCSCGDTVEPDAYKVFAGEITTCGNCNKVTIARENEYYRYSDSLGNSFMFDEEDMELVKSRKWFLSPQGYYKSQGAYLHRLIMGEPDCDVDHRDRDKSNNRRSNFRLATRTQNNGNSIEKGGTSKYKGVHYRANRGSWVASIRHNNVRRHLGTFATEELAAKAYNAAAKELFGEFALLNEV